MTIKKLAMAMLVLLVLGGEGRAVEPIDDAALQAARYRWSVVYRRACFYGFLSRTAAYSPWATAGLAARLCRCLMDHIRADMTDTDWRYMVAHRHAPARMKQSEQRHKRACVEEVTSGYNVNRSPGPGTSY